MSQKVQKTEQRDQESNLVNYALVNNLYERSNLTRLQVLYWVSQSLRRETQIYNTIYTYSILGAVDCDHFTRAFQTLVQQSDSFRTIINEEDGIPQQRVMNNVPREMTYFDFSEEDNPEMAYDAWLHERSAIILDLAECSYDSALVKMSDTKYVWYLNQHHMLVDANSFVAIFQRLAVLYERSMNGEELTLGEISPFQEYVSYEHKYRRSLQYKKAEAYWREKLTPFPEELSFFGKTQPKKTTNVKRKSFDLGPERSRGLKEIAHQEGLFTVSEELSLYNLFAGMFFVLLYQLSGNKRIGLVTPVHNRFAERFRKTIGLLIEFSPILVELSDDDTLETIIKKVKHESREVLAYYQYGSGIIVQNHGFEVMFNTYQVPEMALNGAVVQAKRIHPGHGTESLALHVTDVEASKSFELHFDFHEDVFRSEQQALIINSYLDLIDKLISEPNQRIGDLAIYTGEKSPESTGNANDDHKYLEFDLPGQVPPKDLLEFQILRIWEEVLNHHSIGVNDNFFDLGGNSWTAVKMFVELEKQTGKYLPLTTLLKAGTVNEIARAIQEETDSQIWPTVITIQSGASQKPIYFAPGAAENGLAVARIAKHLGDDRPVYMFHIPIGNGEKKKTVHIETMAEQYVQALKTVQPNGPYVLGGYSAGGIIAFEAAQQLRKKGQEVELLVIVDVPAQSPKYKYLKRFVRGISSVFKLDEIKERTIFLAIRDVIFRLSFFVKRGFIDWVISNKERYGRFLGKSRRDQINILKKKFAKSTPDVFGNTIGQSPEIGSIAEGDELWKEYDRHMRDHFHYVNEAVKCYVPETYPGKVILFRSTIGYRRPEMRMADPNMGWDMVVDGDLNTFKIPGNHLQIVREPNVALLGQQLKACLDTLPNSELQN
jgi:thioesterase domain-containing protein/acyl carrier protein